MSLIHPSAIAPHSLRGDGLLDWVLEAAVRAGIWRFIGRLPTPVIVMVVACGLVLMSMRLRSRR